MKIVEVLEDGIQRLNRVGHRRHKLPRYSSSKITNTLYDQTYWCQDRGYISIFVTVIKMS